MGDGSIFGEHEFGPSGAGLTDCALVHAVGRGSGAAFGVLFERHHGTLYRLAARRLGDPAEAEDVVQDAFARLWQFAARWTPSGAGLSGWLRRVTLNLCIDRKRRFRVTLMPDVPDRADDAPLADRLIEADQARAAVAAALGGLSDRSRTALVLCYFEGYSNAAAADLLDINIKALESQLFRARHQLRAILSSRREDWQDLAASI